MTQNNMKRGLQNFGDQGVAAAVKELRQLLTMDSIKPDNPKDLNK